MRLNLAMKGNIIARKSKIRNKCSIYTIKPAKMIKLTKKYACQPVFIYLIGFQLFAFIFRHKEIYVHNR